MKRTIKKHILVPNLWLGSQLIIFSLAFDIISLVKLTNDSDKSKHFNVVMDIGASHETEEIINCIYQSSEIESNKGSIVAEKPSDVFNDSDSNELETDNI